MRKLLVAVTIGAAFALSAPASYGLGIPAKLKSKKVQGNLVPAYKKTATAGNTGEDTDAGGALIAVAVPRTNCTFEQGKFKIQVGSDAAIKLKGVKCGGVDFTGSLCAHTKILATIMDDDLDKDGMSTGLKTCPSTGGPIQGKMNWVTGNIGSLSCSAGACEGTLAVVTSDPCPDVDKVAEVRRLEVFSGNDSASIVVLGTPIKACCGPGQTVVGTIGASAVAPCTTSTQDVMAEMGTVTQGVSP